MYVIKMTLVESAKELLCLQDLEHLSEVPNIDFGCLSIDKNVIQIGQDALP